MLVAVTPRAPVDAFTPVLAQTRSGRKQIFETSCQDNLLGVEVLLTTVELARYSEVGVVALGLDLGDGAVGESNSSVVSDLLASQPAVVGGSDTCENCQRLNVLVVLCRCLPSLPMTSCMWRVAPLRYTPESINKTLRRTRARPLRALNPEGPPPTMMASKSIRGWVSATGAAAPRRGSRATSAAMLNNMMKIGLGAIDNRIHLRASISFLQELD